MRKEDSNSGNEEEDPHDDDTDMSDCDETPNVTEDGRENMNSPSNPNKFDDEY